MKYIIFLILGILLILISFLTKEKNDADVASFKTEGTIEKIIYSDSGNVRYYVNFLDNGTELQGQSIHYSVTNRKYHEGDKVDISYHFAKNGKPIVEVVDDDLVPCKNSLSKFSKGCFIIGVVLIVVYLGIFIKSILGA